MKGRRHRLLVGRKQRLADAGNTVNARPFAAGWPAHPIPDGGGIEIKLGQSTAECVAVHPKLFGGLALVALMVGKHFEDVAFLELANGFRVGDARAMHLRDETVHFALQDIVLACRS